MCSPSGATKFFDGAGGIGNAETDFFGSCSFRIFMITKMFILKTNMYTRFVAKVINYVKFGISVDENVGFTQPACLPMMTGMICVLLFLQ